MINKAGPPLHVDRDVSAGFSSGSSRIAPKGPSRREPRGRTPAIRFNVVEGRVVEL